MIGIFSGTPFRLFLIACGVGISFYVMLYNTSSIYVVHLRERVGKFDKNVTRPNLESMLHHTDGTKLAHIPFQGNLDRKFSKNTDEYEVIEDNSGIG